MQPTESSEVVEVAAPPSARVQVTLVHAEACHFCDDAGAALAEFAREYPLDIRLVPLESPEGMAAFADHRPAMSPLILVDGEYFSSGRLPRKKLRALIHERTTRESPDSAWEATSHGH